MKIRDQQLFQETTRKMKLALKSGDVQRALEHYQSARRIAVEPDLVFLNVAMILHNSLGDLHTTWDLWKGAPVLVSSFGLQLVNVWQRLKR